MRKWESIKQSKLLVIKSRILSNLLNEKYELKLGEFNNTTGSERVKHLQYFSIDVGKSLVLKLSKHAHYIWHILFVTSTTATNIWTKRKPDTRINKDFDLLRKDCECYSLFMEQRNLQKKGEFQNVLFVRFILLLFCYHL